VQQRPGKREQVVTLVLKRNTHGPDALLVQVLAPQQLGSDKVVQFQPDGQTRTGELQYVTAQPLREFLNVFGQVRCLQLGVPCHAQLAGQCISGTVLFGGIHLQFHVTALGSSTLGHAGQYIGQALALLQNVKHIAKAGLVLPNNDLTGAQSRALVSYQIVRIKSLVTGVKQVNGPGIGIAVLCSSEQITVGGARINAHQHWFVAVEDFVVQTNPDLGEVLGSVNVYSAPSSDLMQVVYAALADRDAQNVAHEFHHATVGAVADESEG
jgi:hypothetical protein